MQVEILLSALFSESTGPLLKTLHCILFSMGDETSGLRGWTVSISDGVAGFGVSMTFRDGFQAFWGGIFIAELGELGHFSSAMHEVT